jgi:soluble lytic murein transglycosylase-like protein
MSSNVAPHPHARLWRGVVRGVVRSVGAVALCCGVALSAHAGAQMEEPLADKVRGALSAAIAQKAPPTPVFSSDVQRVVFERWAGASDDRLVKKKPEELVRREFLQTVWYEAKRAGLDPGLVMGLIEVESGFRKYAISSVGARGYMQVMPFWTRSIGDGNASALFHMQTNLRFGCVILRHYLDLEKGNLYLALGRYNGSRGKAPYPNAVTAAWKRWTVPSVTVASSGDATSTSSGSTVQTAAR